MRQTFLTHFGKVETQPMGDASTPIVGTHKELLVPKVTHRLDLVQRHCAERVVEVAISVGRATRIPVSSQIRYADRELLGESRRHFVPSNVALGISMQKEHWWSVAFVKNRDGRSAGANLSLRKSREKVSLRHPSTVSAAVRAKIRVDRRPRASLRLAVRQNRLIIHRTTLHKSVWH
jgi:hypothetical protein